ncbi:MAG: prolyl oligopeptidase family serine peptidase [Planctomycetota bacterium]|nr:prolyl oligopeptidase family serine peptidase [Planctomycetota bacterium]MEC9096109.1 prolyl oligopeptidase family serine peptidase [Planctomycetota bacterium]
MKTIFLAAGFLPLACPFFAQETFAQVQGPRIATLEPSLQKKTQSLNSRYLVFSPKRKSKLKLPLLVYLHGAGGLGDEIRKIQGQAVKVWQGVQKFGKDPCIVIAPQCSRMTKRGQRGGWIPEDLNLLLQQLKATLPVDDKRIYLTGNSMGGYGSWAWGAHSPEHFAAIAPVVGGIGPDGPKDVTPDLEKWAANLAKVPVYAFAGAKDKVVPAERSQRMVNAIRKAGGKRAKLQIYPNEGHGASRIVFSTPAFYDWMFSKKRDATDRKPAANRDRKP